MKEARFEVDYPRYQVVEILLVEYVVERGRDTVEERDDVLKTPAAERADEVVEEAVYIDYFFFTSFSSMLMSASRVRAESAGAAPSDCSRTWIDLWASFLISSSKRSFE